jgi:hypothetical protein
MKVQKITDKNLFCVNANLQGYTPVGIDFKMCYEGIIFLHEVQHVSAT